MEGKIIEPKILIEHSCIETIYFENHFSKQMQHKNVVTGVLQVFHRVKWNSKAHRFDFWFQFLYKVYREPLIQFF